MRVQSNIDLHIGSGNSCTLLPFNHCLLSVEMQERLRVLMLYHLCSLLLMCLELVVGFIKAPATTAAMQTIVNREQEQLFALSTLNTSQSDSACYISGLSRARDATEALSSKGVIARALEFVLVVHHGKVGPQTSLVHPS